MKFVTEATKGIVWSLRINDNGDAEIAANGICVLLIGRLDGSVTFKKFLPGDAEILGKLGFDVDVDNKLMISLGLTKVSTNQCHPLGEYR